MPEIRTMLPMAFVAVVVFGAFLLAPGSLATKIHLALHGVCAQRPSHSLEFGGVPLPLDARMTGLYTGSAAASLWLISLGRNRAAASLSRPLLGLLTAFVILLIGDGSNALLFDLGLPQLYPPSNLLRLGTGLLAGTSLGVILTTLFARSVWPSGGRELVSALSVREILPPMAISAALGLIALSDLPVLYGPIAIGLLLAVVGVFAMLGMTLLSVTIPGESSMRSWAELAPLAAVSLILAVSVMAALAGFRSLVERASGLPPLT